MAGSRPGPGRRPLLLGDLFVLGDVVARDLERLAAATKFPAAVLGVTIEDTSTRGILRLRNVSGDLEVVRTHRGDADADADADAAMIVRARALVGRRVLAYKDMEGLASNLMHRVRAAVRLMDLGPEPEAIGEDEAKNHVLAADGDKDAAPHAWNGAGLPERGPVFAEQLGRALAAVPVTGRPAGTLRRPRRVATRTSRRAAHRSSTAPGQLELLPSVRMTSAKHSVTTGFPLGTCHSWSVPWLSEVR